jgi:hypothetical protein
MLSVDNNAKLTPWRTLHEVVMHEKASDCALHSQKTESQVQDFKRIQIKLSATPTSAAQCAYQ